LCAPAIAAIRVLTVKGRTDRGLRGGADGERDGDREGGSEDSTKRLHDVSSW
jgi:hypothetical protein